MTTEVPLGKLRYGHDPDAPEGMANVRQVGRMDGIDALAQSILGHGVIQPLAVVPGPKGLFYVADGNRRLAACHALVAAKLMSLKSTVAVVLRQAAEAREIGLAANVMRADLHPADRYHAFRELVATGSSHADVAVRFGVSESDVRRACALGDLHPDIVDAWRQGELGDNAVRLLKIFTLASSPKEQVKAFRKVKSQNIWQEYAIKEALGLGNNYDANAALKLVGLKVYEAAGGILTVDLFDDRHVVRDPALAKRLARDKVVQECERLVRTGWAWASPKADLPNDASWQWDRYDIADVEVADEELARLDELEDQASAGSECPLAVAAQEVRDVLLREIEDRYLPAVDRALSGVSVGVFNDGTLSYCRGLVRPGAGQTEGEPSAPDDLAQAAVSPVAPAAPKSRISGALATRLDRQREEAFRDALHATPQVGLAMLLAGATATWSNPMSVRVGRQGEATAAVRFKDEFERFCAMSLDELLAVAAGVAGRGLEINSERLGEEVDAVGAALDHGVLGQTLAARFDLADYLGSVPKALVLEAVGEVLGADAAKRLKDWKKGDLIADCSDDLRRVGWLPPELRPAGYQILTPVEQAAAA